MIGILSFLSPRYAQFIYKYTNILDANGVEYEVVFWNREGVDYNLDENWIGYGKTVNTFQPFYKKIGHFFGFTFFMYKQILEKKYDKLIVLTTQAAIPLFPLLISKYKGRYIYDYRDITYENISIYKWAVNQMVKRSYFTAVSSRGFIESGYLSQSDKYVMSHNTRDFKIKEIQKEKSSKIRVVYWGMVRQLEFNKKVCDLFGRDDRFLLSYHGAGFHKELENYCREMNYNNIYFTGAYKLDDIPRFVETTDFVLNTYENDKQQKPAMTVKFYDSLMYLRPMIVMSGSYMGEICDKEYLGISIDIHNQRDLNHLYNQIVDFDHFLFARNAKEMASLVAHDDEMFSRRLLKIDDC